MTVKFVCACGGEMEADVVGGMSEHAIAMLERMKELHETTCKFVTNLQQIDFDDEVKDDS